jgi:hypothetical protein
MLDKRKMDEVIINNSDNHPAKIGILLWDFCGNPKQLQITLFLFNIYY